MSQTIVDISCPGCGFPVSTSMKECPACSKPVIITSFNSVFNMPLPQVNKYANTYRKALQENPDDQNLNTSIAMCYLKLKMYDKADEAFEKAIEENFDNSETFYYAAVSLLAGKIAFSATRPKINRILELLNAATMIEPRGIYYYFMAYIKYDYFSRKYLNVSPNYQSCLEEADMNNVSEFDKENMYILLNVAKPATFS